MTKKVLIFAALLFTVLMPANSQTADMKFYTLNECLQLANKNNYDIKLSKAQTEYSKADLTSAFGNYLPSLNFQTGYSRTLNPGTVGNYDFSQNPPQYYMMDAPANSYSMNFNASLNIFDGFSREANYERADKTVKSSEVNQKFVNSSINNAVYSYYVNIVRNLQIVRIRRENIELGKTELQSIQAKYEAGVLPISSVYAQEADLGNREIELVNAENELNNAKAQILLLMGLNPDNNTEFDVNSIPNNLNSSEALAFKTAYPNINSAVKTAIENRLDLESQALNLDAADASRRSAKGAYYPSLNASASWNFNNTKFSGFSDKGKGYAGLTLNIPIFQNFNTDLRVQSSELQYEQSRINYLKTEQNIRSNVQTAFLNLEASEKQIEISIRTVKAAEQNYLSMKERQTVGAANMTELLTANNQFITAKINQINAIYSYYLAKNELVYSMGIN